MYIGNNQIEDEGLCEMAKHLLKDSKLERLYFRNYQIINFIILLANNCIGDNGAFYLCKFKYNLMNIREMNFGNI